MMKTPLFSGFHTQLARTRPTPKPAHSALLLIAVGILGLGTSAAMAGQRIQSTDLTYLGTINITQNDANCGDSPNARATGLTFNPSGNGGAGSFYITGRNATHCVAEITRPPVGGTATFIQNYSDPTNGTADKIGDCYNGCFIGGHLIYNGSLYLTAFSYYDAGFTATRSLWRHSLTLTNHSGMVGPVAAGPGNQGMYNQYMDNVPSAFQSMLGGPAVIGGCCFSIITRTSLGPALYAFNPENPGTVTPLLGYPDGHQTLNSWGASGSHPEANPTTKIGGVTFIEGTDTVMFVGHTGKGNYCYGEGSTCGDPDNPYKGGHAAPYAHWVWLYDVDDLAAVKSGAKQMWDVLPYANFELPALGAVAVVDDWSANGVAFDPVAKQLYIFKGRESDGSAWPQIHVFNVNVSATGSTATPPPPAPANLIVK
jgi:hypothetical protein